MPQRREGRWTEATLETHLGPQKAHVFKHAGRKGLPDIYRLTERHPLRPDDFTTDHYHNSKRDEFNDYVVTIRKNTKFMRDWHEAGQNVESPTGDLLSNFAKGWLKFGEGDMLWVRNLDGTKNPEDDAICFYYICGGVMRSEDRETIQKVGREVLGPRIDRKPGKPTVNSRRDYNGGTAFERSHRAKPVKENARCYTNAYSFQVPNKISSPTVGSKRVGDDEDNLAIRTNINHKIPTIAADHLNKTAPRSFCDVISEYGDMLNTQSVGQKLQHYFSGVQVNISPAASAANDATFTNALGQFAKPHIDKGDAPAALSAMTQFLDIPKGYERDIFAYHDFMIFIQPEDIYTAFFTGLHRHGGSAPYPRPGTETTNWAYRVTFICYPNGQTMKGQSRNPLAPFWGSENVRKDAAAGGIGNDVLKMPPEIRFRQKHVSRSPPRTRTKAHRNCRSDCNKANLARDGPSMQGPQAVLTSVFREFAIVLNHVLQVLRGQYPDYTINADYNRLCLAISMIENGGGQEVIHPIPWQHAPAPDGNTVGFKDRLGKCRDFMEAFAMHTPFYFLTKTPGSGSIRGLQVDAASHDEEGEEGEDEDGGEDEDEAQEQTVSNRPTTRGPHRKPRESTGASQGNPRKRKAPAASNGRKESGDQEITETTGDRGQPQKKRLRSDREPSYAVNIPRGGTGDRGIHFKLLVDVDWPMIGKEIVSLEDSMKLVAREGKLPDKDLVEVIASVNPEVLNTPEIRSTWKQLARADGVIEIKPAAARVLTALSLKARSDIWNWFYKNVTEPVLCFEERLDGVTWPTDINKVKVPNPWIARLYTAVRRQRERHSNPGGTVHLKAADYFMDLDAEDYLSSSGSQNLCHVERALFSWLDFQTRPGTTLDTSRAVGSFITTASKALRNTDFLYLNSIQQRVKTIHANLTVERVPLRDIPWEGLCEVLTNHPLADPTSSEAAGLARLKDLLWVASGLPRPDSILKDRSGLIEEYQKVIENPSVEHSLEFRDFLAQTLPGAHSATQEDEPVQSVASSRLSSLCLSPPESPPSSPAPEQSGILMFLHFLSTAAHVAKGSPPLTPTQSKILSDPDRYLPFRQLAPSKRIVLNDPQGPFSPERRDTRAGLFDAIIFRLITQASPILLEDKRVRFGSLAGFEHAVEGRERMYYCKPNATGRYSRLKNVPHAERYWEQTAGWEDFIRGGDVSFDSLLKWFTGRQDGAKRFPGMGHLVGWLLASDYASACLVDVPSAFDVGKIIFRINAGGKRGLSILGFDTNDEEACGTAMEAILGAVLNEFEPEERAEMGLDVITIEHALCKLWRLYDVFSEVNSSPPILYIKTVGLTSLDPDKGDPSVASSILRPGQTL